MASVDDYVTEKILTYTRLALYSLKLVNIPIVGDLIKKKATEDCEKFRAKADRHENRIRIDPGVREMRGGRTSMQNDTHRFGVYRVCIPK